METLIYVIVIVVLLFVVIKRYNTFKDLQFEKRTEFDNLGYGENYQAKMFFKDHGVSVLKGRAFYSDGDSTYELAVLDKEGNLDYSTPITDDVEGYLTQKQVDGYLRQIQRL